MTKGLSRSRGRGLPQDQSVLRVRESGKVQFSFTAAQSWDSAVIASLPEGNLLYLGGIIQIIAERDGNLVDAWEGDFSVGFAHTSNRALAGNEDDFIPATGLPAAVDGNISRRTYGSAARHLVDNTDANNSVVLNFLVDVADISTDPGTVEVSYFVDLAFIVLGDD